MKKKLTQTQAIRAFCISCIYDPHGGNGSMYDQIEACTAPDCALYEHRPLTTATKDKLRDEKIAAMNSEELAKYRDKQEIAKVRMDNLRQQGKM